jgi:4-cresol dehydrogenase (hydroxylating)
MIVERRRIAAQVERNFADERWEAAAREWRTLLGADAVRTGAEERSAYGENTLDAKRRVRAVLFPKNVGEVVALLKIAVQYEIPLYPISTGKNWGYGCASPVADDCVVVHLAGLNRIVEFDAELGCVTVEPGVTQRQLADYLDEKRLPYLVPATGAGPDAGLLGNVLERGFAITPYADHFGALTALEAVLPNGEIYRSALSDLGGREADRLFKWGLGPYLDGMFTQSNFAIVTSVTIALAPRPQRTEAVFFSVRREADLERAVVAVREILRRCGGVSGMMNLMNAQRMLSMMMPYPNDQVAPGTVMADALVAAAARKNMLTPWTGVGCLYGEAAQVRAARKLIRRALRPFVKRLTFLTPQKIAWLNKAAAWIPFVRNSQLGRTLERLEAAVTNFAGRPSDIALPLTYWRGGVRRPNQAMDPAGDGCGLIWYAPLVPMKAERARMYVELVRRTCVEFGLEPLITLTSVSDRCFDSTVPLLFDRRDPEQTARARACYQALFERGRREGFLPFRAGIELMDVIADKNVPFWRLVDQIKRAVDPKNILAPGRYAPRSELAADSQTKDRAD